MWNITKIKKWVEAERARRFLWLPAGFAIGIAIYFVLPTEPRWWPLVLLNLVVLALAVKLRYRPMASQLAWFALAITIGLAWSTAQTHWQSMVSITHAYEPQRVSGTLREMQRTAEGFRITLDQVTIEHLAAEETPSRVRLTLRPKRGEFTPALPIGTQVELVAGLLPPMGPALPGGFDFARFFYFNHIGAIGFGLPPLKVIPPPIGGRLGGGLTQSMESDSAPLPTSPRWREELTNQFWTWRVNLTDHILQTLGPRIGPVAAGFITGDARAISQEDFELWRASNLYHLIAISGEHMMVISGVIFLLLRWLTLCLPSRWRYLPEMKSLAAALTLALVSVYLFVTGLPVSAIRAFIMIALVLLAIILRRQVNAMRSLFIAGLLMLIYSPADLFDPGFQLSFSATLALIALIEFRRRRDVIMHSRWQQMRGHLCTLLLASLVAETATLPFVLSQFNTVSIYGIVANTLATPLVSLFLMPLVALFFLALPLGLADSVLWLMDKGIRALLWIAETVSGWPQALQAFPSPPAWAVAAFALGLLWLCIWQKRPRYLALPVMVVALISPLFVRTPDMLIGAQLKQLAFRTEDGYVLARGRESSLLPKLWANGLGYTEFTELEKNAPIWRCDALGCVATVKHHRVAFPSDALALTDDCALADVVVSSLTDIRCDGKTLIDGKALRTAGIHALWFNESGIHIETASQWQKKRPWNSGVEE